MAQQKTNEIVQAVPADLTRKCKGLSLDIGSSVMKIVYRSHEDAEDVAKSEDVKYGHLHLVSFPKTQLDEAVEYLRERASITRNSTDELVTVYVTGTGVGQLGKTFNERLNIKLQQENEFGCFIKSFVYLVHRLPRTELLRPFIEEAAIDPLDFMKCYQPMMEQFQTTATYLRNVERFSSVGRGPSAAALTAGDVPLSEAEPDIFPCMLAMCGSGFMFFKIDSDGSPLMADGSLHGGKSFLGLGRLLTRCKTYDELMELALKGDRRGVDIFNDELFQHFDTTDNNSSVDYSNMYMGYTNTKPSPMLSFGKAADRPQLDEFKREDVAKAFLDYSVSELVYVVHLFCQKYKVKRVFFCGGYCEHPFVRQLISADFIKFNQFELNKPSPSIIDFDFIKPGAYLGALGCALNDVAKLAGK
jgi:type II pantothenate kinase